MTKDELREKFGIDELLFSKEYTEWLEAEIEKRDKEIVFLSEKWGKVSSMHDASEIEIDKLQGQNIFAHITLQKGERSELANLANDLL